MHKVLERQLRRLGITGLPTEDQWAKLLCRVDRAYVEADQDRYTLERSLDLSSTEMRKRFSALRDAQEALVAASRRAGMADVATSVLHNIGNVLNSVNVSSNVVVELVKTSSRAGLGKGLALLRSQPAPGKFLDEDPRGRKLQIYFEAIAAALEDERTKSLQELAHLSKNIEHIKVIVSQQLATARGEVHASTLYQRVNLTELTDDAVTVLRASVDSSSAVRIVCDRDAVVLETDRHKVFQILMNLLTNARDALQGNEGTIRLAVKRSDDGRVLIAVSDDGVGIERSSLGRVFVHGFTTKAEGHGFGLHSSACAAVELGGSLSADSAGPRQGATFTLSLPVTRAHARMTASSRPAARAGGAR